MNSEMLKIDLRKADKDDLKKLAQIMMGISRLFSSQGYKVHLKRTKPACTEHQFK